MEQKHFLIFVRIPVSVCPLIMTHWFTAIKRIYTGSQQRHPFLLQLQYLYLHEIVAEATHSGSLPVDQEVFPEYVQDLEEVENKSGITYMQFQYEVTRNLKSDFFIIIFLIL